MFFDHNETKLNESVKSIITAIESDLTMLFRNGDEILSKEDFNDTAKRCKIMIDAKEKSFLNISNMYMQFISARNKHNKLYIKDRGELKLVCIDEEKYKELPTCEMKKYSPVRKLHSTIHMGLIKGLYSEELYEKMKKATTSDSKYMNYYRSSIVGLSELKEIKSSEYNLLLSSAFDIYNPQAVSVSFLKKKIKSVNDYDTYMSDSFVLKDFIKVKDYIKEVKQTIYTLTEQFKNSKKIEEIEKYRFMCNFITVATQYYLIILDNILLAYTAKMEARKKALDNTFEINK